MGPKKKSRLLKLKKKKTQEIKKRKNKKTDSTSGHYTSCVKQPCPRGDWWYYNNSVRRLARDCEMETNDGERTYGAFIMVPSAYLKIEFYFKQTPHDTKQRTSTTQQTTNN